MSSSPAIFARLRGCLLRSAVIGAIWLASVPTASRGQSAAYDPPTTYYSAAKGKTGSALQAALHTAIASHTALSYTPGVWNALTTLDAVPTDPTRVILIYAGLTELAANKYTGGSTTAGTWDREHLWCQSYMNDTSANPDALIRTDVFNLRAIDYNVNGTRGNLYYDTSTAPVSTLSSGEAPGSTYDRDSWDPRDADKGTIARSMFYMATCYDGTSGSITSTKLILSDTPNSGNNTFGKLSVLLAWNRKYPVTEAERLRNQTIYSNYQGNRNPYVDNRYYADMVFGGLTAQTAWLKTRFTDTELTQTTVSGDLAAPAGDGISNLAKYAFNLDPKTASASGLPTASLTTVSGVKYLTLTHRQNRQASGISFHYQISNDLKNWSEVTPSSTTVTHLDADATDQVVARVPTSGAPQFIRLSISKP